MRAHIVTGLALALGGAPAAAQEKAPARTPRAEPPARRAHDEHTCNKDRDCVFLPSVCATTCPPCKPTWRRVGNRRAAARIRKMRAAMECPKVKCTRCAKRSNWLGTKPVCVKGRCRVEGQPGAASKACYRACLRRSQVKAISHRAIEAACRRECRRTIPPRPARPRSKDRACKKSSDCVLMPRAPCTCPPCSPVWHRAVNRKALAAWRRKWAVRRCRQPVCPACVAQYLGTHAACIKGQCTVQP